MKVQVQKLRQLLSKTFLLRSTIFTFSCNLIQNVLKLRWTETEVEGMFKIVNASFHNNPVFTNIFY